MTKKYINHKYQILKQNMIKDTDMHLVQLFYSVQKTKVAYPLINLSNQ